MNRADQSGRRLQTASSVARLMTRLLTPAARRRGFAEASIIADWSAIVGRGLAARCQPARIEFRPGTRQQGVLHVRARAGAGLELEHASREIIERINDYLGFRAVRQIRVSQGAWPRPQGPATEKPPRKLNSAEKAELSSALESVEQEDLQQALSRLGATLKIGAGH